MSWTVIRKLSNPVLLLTLALLLRPYVVTLNSAYIDLVQYLPYILFTVVFTLCIYYNRSRLFVVTLSLSLIYYCIQTKLQTSLSLQETLLIYSLISFLQPLVLFNLIFLPERGLLNRHGLLYFSCIVLVVLFSAYMINYHANYLTQIATDWVPVKPVSGIVLSLPAIACYLMVFATGLYRFIKFSDDFALMIVTVSVFSLVTLALFDLMNISAVVFTAVSLSLIIGMMGTSYDMAFRDELTGLLGRRALNERLKGLARQYVIAMMDIDHFKKFNDTHGHDIGDEVLKMVAQQIARVEGGGTAYRYGGEEFCVVFAGKDKEYARSFLEDTRLRVQNYQMKIRDSAHRPSSKQIAEKRRGRRAKSRDDISVSVTISIGFAESDGINNNPETVLKRADTALYKAKKKGRNCLAS